MKTWHGTWGRHLEFLFLVLTVNHNYLCTLIHIWLSSADRRVPNGGGERRVVDEGCSQSLVFYKLGYAREQGFRRLRKPKRACRMFAKRNYNNTKSEVDWYSVRAEQPVSLSRRYAESERIMLWGGWWVGTILVYSPSQNFLWIDRYFITTKGRHVTVESHLHFYDKWMKR